MLPDGGGRLQLAHNDGGVEVDCDFSSLDSLKFTAHVTFDGCYRSSEFEVTLKTGIN